VDFVVNEELAVTRRNPLPHHDHRSATAIGVGMTVASYLVMLMAQTIVSYGEDWPPERPSELFGRAFMITLGLVIASFVLGMVAKLNHRRYHYAGLLGTLTVATCAIALWGQLGDTLVYNLRYPILREAV